MSLENQGTSELTPPVYVETGDFSELQVNEKNANETSNNARDNDNNKASNSESNENEDTSRDDNGSAPTYYLLAGIPFLWMLARFIKGFSRRAHDCHGYRHNRGWGRGWGRGRGWVRGSSPGWGYNGCCNCHRHHHHDYCHDYGMSTCDNYHYSHSDYMSPSWFGYQRYGRSSDRCQDCANRYHLRSRGH